MPRFSANIGFLYTEFQLPERIQAAARAGFGAVELHWPYETRPGDVADAAEAAGIQILALNTPVGSAEQGEYGLAALPGRESEFLDGVHHAVAYAKAIRAGSVHCMAGITGSDDIVENYSVYLSNIHAASTACAAAGLNVLIEPINGYDRPGYFLKSVGMAAKIIQKIGNDNIRIMFDCYHAQLLHGNIIRNIREFLPVIGHVQIASVPDRRAPDHGELDYSCIYRELDDLGYSGWVGAEYMPHARTDETLGWYQPFR